MPSGATARPRGDARVSWQDGGGGPAHISVPLRMKAKKATLREDARRRRAAIFERQLNFAAEISRYAPEIAETGEGVIAVAARVARQVFQKREHGCLQAHSSVEAVFEAGTPLMTFS